MLGHNQYAKYMQKIRNYLSSGVPTESTKRQKKPYYSKFSKINKDQTKYVESWVDIFIEHEIHMIGFGLDYTENHLWNLIMEKQRLRREKPEHGSLIFHRCSDEKQSIEDEARISLLKSFDVKVIDHTEDSFKSSYELCIRSLAE
jgi:hypothetical protein